MSPYFDLEELRQVEGFENARFADPYAGGKGNSVRYMSVGVRDGYMRACGLSNLLLGGEKSGFCRSYGSHIHRFTGGYNGAMMAAGKPMLKLPAHWR